MPDRFCVYCDSMDEEKNAVPYIVHEGVLARMERQLRRQFITIIILIVALILSNSVWLYSFMQYDYSSEMIMASQDGRGINIVGGGDVQFGTDSDYNSETP